MEESGGPSCRWRGAGGWPVNGSVRMWRKRQAECGILHIDRDGSFRRFVARNHVEAHRAIDPALLIRQVNTDTLVLRPCPFLLAQGRESSTLLNYRINSAPQSLYSDGQIFPLFGGAIIDAPIRSRFRDPPVALQSHRS